MRNDESVKIDKPKREHPLWETIVMALSFVLLWAWFLARQAALRAPTTTMWPGWTALQILAIVALVIVMVRRMARVRRALREGSRLPNQLPFPVAMTSRNKDNHKKS